MDLVYHISKILQVLDSIFLQIDVYLFCKLYEHTKGVLSSEGRL